MTKIFLQSVASKTYYVWGFGIFLLLLQSCSGSAGGVDVWEAVEKENLKAIEQYVKAGGDVNCQSWDGVTPLLNALINRKRKSYEKLLKLGANPNIIADNVASMPHYNRSVMTDAARIKDTFWIKLALEHGGNPNLQIKSSDKVRNSTVYQYALENDAFENIKLLVKHEMDLNLIDKRGETPLVLAANYARFDIVYFLLEAGANYKQKGTKGSESFIEFMRTRELGEYPDEETNQWLAKVFDWLKARGAHPKAQMKVNDRS
ncbi:Ankyrin repeats (3 copies) [Gimesia alba]|uniref:Ankyrin repeats (3 copies) n=1 Tax=Gimesia alba TaxID=2527973 RepID=A0A517RJJ8_9PLAN|nr:ankyrin repeat domain-containing protein [Gimesia alba]QDT44036.1 Ankyrin repeats (3 copies) [Gimesia alba]